MWTVLRDAVVVPALLWISPLSADDRAIERGHVWESAECDEDRQSVQGRRARPSSADPAPALRRHAPALYP